MSINPRIIAFLALIGFLIFIVFGANGFLFPNKVKKVINEPAPIIIEKYITVTVTPTPDGHIYFANEYENGTRLIKRPFTFIRYNALGNQDLKVTTIVYNYMFFNKLHWFNPTTYKYQEQLPSEGKKFCFIFITTWMDNIGGDDTRMWSFNRSYFGLFNEQTNEMYQPMEYPYQLRFHELENTPTYNNVEKVQAFRSYREYSSDSNYVDSAGEYNDEKYYLRGGISNAIDGYLIYEIPRNTPANKLVEFGRLHEMGFSQWRLEA